MTPRRALLVSLLAATGLVASVEAQPATQPLGDVSAGSVRFTSGADQIDAFIAKPRIDGKRPAVVVVHDDLGLNDTIRDVTRLFSQAGFVALAPNLVSRGPGTLPPASGTQGAGTTNRQRLPVAQSVNDVLAAYEFLQHDGDVDAARISAVGFGWGGYRVWKAAERLPSLHRAVVYYAVTPAEDDVRTIKASVLGHYAQYDFLLTASVLKTQKQLGKKFTYHIYPVDRGFMSGGTGNALDISALAGEINRRAVEAEKEKKVQTPTADASAASAALAFRRTLAFLRD